MGVEAFTVMAVLDATDKASEIFERVKGVIERFSGVLGDAATTAEAAGAAIDESLLQTASGADALALANDRLAGAEAKVTLATEEQAVAERNLMEVRAQGLGLNELAAASDKLTAANKAAAMATAELRVAQEAQIAVEQAATGVTAELAAAEEAAATASTGIVGMVAAAGVAMAGAGALATKAAGDFQSAMVHLTTDAGESTKNLGMVSDAMLQIAQDTGTSTTDMALGMYHVESAGFHGAEGINMMRIAAEGAKVGNAELDTVTKTLAGTMDSYKEKNYTAVQMMNMMIETTAAGDLRMQNLASSLGNVTPIAASAGIGFEQVGGAIATMTAQNMSAAQSTQNLAHLISSLSKPNNVQIEEMRQMGVDSNDLSQNLGQRGLTGTLDILMEAIARHTQGGQVFIDSMRDSEAASRDADKMLSLMAPNIRKLSEDLMNGKTSVGDYTKAIKDLGPQGFEQGKQFLTLNERMGAFNKLLSSGKPEAETFNAALANMTGGQVSLRTALMLSANGGEYFHQAVEKIGDASKETGNEVKNWDTIQGTFNQKLSEMKSSFEVLGIKIGTMLLPYIQKLVDVFAKVGDWMMKNKPLVEGVAIALGVTLVTALTVVAAVAAAVVGALALVGGIFYAVWEGAKYLWKGLVYAWEGISAAAVGLWHMLQSAWDAIVDGVTTAWNWVANITSKVWGAIYDFFAKWWPLLLLIFEPPIALIIGLWNHLHDQIMSVVHFVWDHVYSFLSGTWNQIVRVAKDVWGVLYDYLIHPFWEALKYLNGISNDIQNAVKGLINDVLSWVWNKIKDFYNFGQNLVQGIIDGVNNKASSLFHALGDLAESALKFAKNVIGVKSPSRRFADEVGKMIPLGIAVGVQENGNKARDAVGDLADSLTGSANLGVGLKFPYQSAAGTGGGATTIIDMRGSQLMSDRDMDVFVDRVGRRLATRILPAGGVRIQA